MAPSNPTTRRVMLPHWSAAGWLVSGIIDRPQQVADRVCSLDGRGRAMTLGPQPHRLRQDFPEHLRRYSRMAATRLVRPARS